MPSEHTALADPSLFKVDASQLMGYSAVKNRDDTYEFSERGIRVKDSYGVSIVYEAAVADLHAIEDEIVRMGTLFVRRHENSDTATGSPDRVTMLLDALESEVLYNEAKRKVPPS